jgi:hypothetical protein
LAEAVSLTPSFSLEFRYSRANREENSLLNGHPLGMFLSGYARSHFLLFYLLSIICMQHKAGCKHGAKIAIPETTDTCCIPSGTPKSKELFGQGH